MYMDSANLFSVSQKSTTPKDYQGRILHVLPSLTVDAQNLRVSKMHDAPQ